MEKLSLPVDALKRFLSENADCEAIGANEYVADLYDAAPPITVNLSVGEDGVTVLAAAELLFDEEQDGWYMGARLTDAKSIERAFQDAMLSGGQ